MIGQQIGNYKILEQIGAGGFGAVYRAYETPIEREVAVKVIFPEHAANPEFQQRFENEARLVAKLEHPHIIPLYNFWQDSNGAFLVMRYVQGGSLREILRRQGALSFAQTTRIIGQISEALAAAHEAGVVHRDLKPENILLDIRGNAYLTDFGIAKQVNGHRHLTDTDAVIGTMAYLSPEQLQGAKATPQSDIYALGIILYEVLAGEHPFADAPVGMLVMKHLQEPLPAVTTKRPDLPITINGVIAKATAKSSQERYPAAHSIMADLSHTDHATVLLRPIAAPASPEFATVIERPIAAVPATPAGRNRHAMLQNVRTFWVEGVLENSLHGAAMIELGMKPERGFVNHPWDTLLRTASGEERLPPGTRIATVFERLNGKLLILGDPGSGKTTTMLDLARDLLQRAEADSQHPIPVVFNLASWSEKQPPLSDWLAEELNGKYQVPRKVAKEWVESDALLLLLDGLDEVAADRRDTCVQAINTYREEHGFVDVVVCSRIRDYEALTNQLKLNGAIVIQPLDDDQITLYLNALGADVAVVRDLITRDEQLRELAQSPLMLSIMVLAYRGGSGSDIPDFEDIEMQRKHLFDTYVQRMFERRGEEKTYTQEKTIHYLSWLAKKMQAQAFSVFHIESLQPDWLTEQQQAEYHIRVPFILGLLNVVWLGSTFFLIAGGYGASHLLSALLIPVLGALSGLIFTNNQWRKLPYHILFGVTYGIIMGILIQGTYGMERALLFGGLSIVNVSLGSYNIGRLMTSLGYGKDHIRLAEDLQFSRTNIKWGAAIAGFIIGSMVIIPSRFVFASGSVPAMKLIAGTLVSGVLYSLFELYSSGLIANTIESRTRPNQGIRTSLWNANRLAGVVLIPFLMIGLFGLSLVVPLIVGISVALILGFGACTSTWTVFGGYTTIQHVALRSILHRDGLIPRNYALFLDYAASLILLRKVGGGYVFIHRYLLEYFAAQEPS